MTRFERQRAPVVRAAAIAPEPIAGGLRRRPLPGCAVADEREHCLPVALDERRPDALDPRQLGRATRAAARRSSRACGCGRPCRRACRRSRARRHSRSALEQRLRRRVDARRSGASRASPRARRAGVSERGSGRPIVSGSQTSQQRPIGAGRDAGRRSARAASGAGTGRSAEDERLDRAVGAPRPVARLAADRPPRAGCAATSSEGHGQATAGRRLERAQAGALGDRRDRSRSRSSLGASITRRTIAVRRPRSRARRRARHRPRRASRLMKLISRPRSARLASRIPRAGSPSRPARPTSW